MRDIQLRRLAWLGLFVLAAHPAAGQDLGVHIDTLSGAQPYVLHSFVRPGTEDIYHQGQKLGPSEYRIDYRFGRLWVEGLTGADTLVAHYRTWGLALQDQYGRALVRTEAPTTDSTGKAALPAPIEPRREAMSLSRTGSITRGVLAGNNRDAIIESGLRLQLEGKVTEDIRVQAVLTDESTPILPEGTTQRLSELDRVYIEIAATQGLARLGDFAVDYQAGEFARLGRKVQGIGITAQPSIGDVAGSVEAMGATARGIFRREQVRLADGVQGPYRLTGEQNEQFIFIVPGSEEVYLDGRRLQRGQTHDYVIDYATGEITFTANRLIRDRDRVVVEFQYRTTEFTRTLIGAASDVSIGQWPEGPARATLGATFLREADGRTLSEAFGLTADDEALLGAAGDSTAQRSGAVAVDYEAEAPYVQYVRQDSVVGSTTHEIFAAITREPTGPVFRVNFTRVGEGQGSYVRQGRTTNGLVYQWRGPGLGDHEPVRVLPKPRQHRVVDLRGTVAPVRHLQLFGEWAKSLHDQNRLSALHKGDDSGYAYTGGMRLTPLNVGLGTVALSAHRRHIGAGFASFSRIRPVEVERLWLLNSHQTAATRSSLTAEHETVDEAILSWEASERSSLVFTAGQIALGEQFEAQRKEVSMMLDEARWPHMRYHVIHIRSQDGGRLEDGMWLRQDGRLSVPFFGKQLVPQIRLKQALRTLYPVGSDSLVARSESYIRVMPSVTWRVPIGDVGSAVDVRTNSRVTGGRLQKFNQSVTWDMNFDLKPYKTLTLEGRVGVRHRSHREAFVSDQRPAEERSAVIRWSGHLRPWQRAVQMHWFYEALSERTPSLQEIYIRTGPELGEFVWIDANGNGVIELDEFLPETTQDEGNYVRTLIPSDSLQSVTGLQARVSLDVNPERIWRDAGAGWQRTLRQVSLRTMVNVQEKSRNPAVSDIYFMRLGTFRSPAHTLKGLLVVQQDLFLFRGTPRYGVDLSYRHVRGLNELAAGTESRAADEYRGEARMKITDKWGAALAVSSGARRTTSESFASRNYDIETQAIAPELIFSASPNLQVSLTASHARKAAAGTRGSLWKVPVDVRYAHARKFNVAGRLEAASVVIRGASNARGLAFFELTDGRGEGTSFMWTLSSWYQLSSVLRATLSYNGRSPQDAPTIHVVRMQLSAVF